jgi:hypothetical protein
MRKMHDSRWKATYKDTLIPRCSLCVSLRSALADQVIPAAMSIVKTGVVHSKRIGKTSLCSWGSSTARRYLGSPCITCNWFVRDIVQHEVPSITCLCSTNVFIPPACTYICNVFRAMLLPESLDGNRISYCKPAQPVRICNVPSSVPRIVAQDALPDSDTPTESSHSLGCENENEYRQYQK